jgi:hypothetical protein
MIKQQRPSFKPISQVLPAFRFLSATTLAERRSDTIPPSPLPANGIREQIYVLKVSS